MSENVAIFNNVRVDVYPDRAALNQAAASLIMQHITEGSTRLLVSANPTLGGVYDLLAEEPPDRFSGVTFFGMSAYCRPAGNDSYTLLDAAELEHGQPGLDLHLPTALPMGRRYLPGPANAKATGQYDKLIGLRTTKGIDLAVNGIGKDGRTFGHNLARSAIKSETRLVEIDDHGDVPRHVITVGMATGGRSREIITVVSGDEQAEILDTAIWGEVSTAHPVTQLRKHAHKHLFMVDEAAAAKVRETARIRSRPPPRSFTRKKGVRRY